MALRVLPGCRQVRWNHSRVSVGASRRWAPRASSPVLQTGAKGEKHLFISHEQGKRFRSSTFICTTFSTRHTSSSLFIVVYYWVSSLSNLLLLSARKKKESLHLSNQIVTPHQKSLPVLSFADIYASSPSTYNTLPPIDSNFHPSQRTKAGAPSDIHMTWTTFYSSTGTHSSASRSYWDSIEGIGDRSVHRPEENFSMDQTISYTRNSTRLFFSAIPNLSFHSSSVGQALQGE